MNFTKIQSTTQSEKGYFEGIGIIEKDGDESDLCYAMNSNTDCQ
ncbi:hypothetical protein SAMN05216490_4904 [Mucilaginibacter mallensis]|uniref:Uncharacterized protein n=2 Tax=Mucilaginibacter TaxID=423349 RepID=A0A1H2CDN5_MUCMA|nr:hypothetical protein [Mucilaginibacter lappiensis]SDT68409.1 hypothetical protein SAMN05216490_4904 [Mucilaginibacter mallensis]